MSTKLILLLGVISSAEPAHTPNLRDEATVALKRASAFFLDKVATHGGYVYYYSLDLKQRSGEGKAASSTILVQPPGTPTVGLAYLRAYEATGDRFFLDAARDTAEALVQGQLESGGWTQVIDFEPTPKSGKYRKRKGGSWNASSLDDGQTQSALRFLVLADQALAFKDPSIHEAALFGLDALLKAQFPNGAFPQIWRGPVEARPILKANFPTHDWRTEGRVKNYWDQYTLNDNLAVTVADTLLTAHRVYRDDKYKAALAKLGDFLILARMPEPQPGWCQQYDAEMRPIWARKFEPPAITGWESQGAMETLIKISRYTGDPRYLDPIPAVLTDFEKRLLPDGRVARYYELGTDRPLYMDAKYRLTHDDSTAPAHYGWKQPARFGAIKTALESARKGEAEPSKVRSAKELESEVRAILSSLDEQGRWISTYAGERLVGQPKFPTGFRYLSSEVFARNVETLSEYISGTR